MTDTTVTPPTSTPQRTDVQLEAPGTKVQLTGRVEAFTDQGTALVGFGLPGGGTYGIPQGIAGAKVGQNVTVTATVITAMRDALNVQVDNPADSKNPYIMLVARWALASSAIATAAVAPA